MSENSISNNVKWVNDIGKSLISKVEFSINREVVYSWDIEYEKKILEVWSDFYKSFNKICKY